MARPKAVKAVKTEDDGMMFDLDKLRKELKSEIISLDDSYDFFLTGNPMLDAFVGSGGLPKYQMEYIWGTNSIGKSTLAQQILASYQKQYGKNCIVFYFDREESLTKARLENLGVDISKVLIICPEHIEYITERVMKVAADYASKKVDLFVIWDTIAMTPSKEETDGYEKLGTQARALANMFKKLRFVDLRLTMFALNQHRETISSNMYAPKEPPGGNATKHKSFLTINGGSKKSELWPEAKDVGRCTTLQTIKSKIISPHRKMVFEYTYVHGYDSILTMINYLWKEMKVLGKTNKGRWKFSGEDNTYSLKDLYKYFMTDESVYRWKMVVEDVYNTLYQYDSKEFIDEAQKRIFGYYFKDNKIDLDKFTSINLEVVEMPSRNGLTVADDDEEISIENIINAEEGNDE